MRSVPVSKSFCDPSFAVVERKNVSGWEYPFGTPGSPLSSGTGSFRTICLSPCLHQRLLLWNEQGTYSVFSQIAEQVIRMGAVWLLVGYLEKMENRLQ